MNAWHTVFPPDLWLCWYTNRSIGARADTARELGIVCLTAALLRLLERHTKSVWDLCKRFGGGEQAAEGGSPTTLAGWLYPAAVH